MFDIALVASYIILTFAVGLYNRSKSKTFTSYAQIGNDISGNKLILTATIFASSVGGGTTFGITEKVFSHNLAFAYGLFLTIPIDILIGLYIVPKLSVYHGVRSIGEIVEKFYGKYAQVITGIAALLISIGYLSVQISISGRIFGFLLGVDYIVAVVISYIFLIIYTTIGGLRSVVINNSLQFIAMILTIPTISILGLYYIGPVEFFSSIPQEKYNILTSEELFYQTIYATASFSVMGFYPSFIQRILAGNKAAIVAQAIYLKSAIYFFFLICICINGFLAEQINPQAPNNEALTTLITHIIPQAIMAFIIIGLIATVMSTADSDLNISAVSMVNDVLKPMNITSEKNLLLYAKISCILIGSTVMLLVLRFESVIELVIFSAGLWTPIVVVPLIALLFNKLISKTGFYLCSLSGLLGFVFFSLFNNSVPISPIFFGTLTSLVCFIVFYNILGSPRT